MVPQDIFRSLMKISGIMLAGLMVLTVSSCQSDDEKLPGGDSFMLKNSYSQESPVYFGHEIFKRETGKPFIESRTIANPDFKCYSDFILKIKNGNDKRTRVSSAEIWIDGVMVAGPSDFSKNVTLITKSLPELKPESVLEVRLNSTPGSFIDLWIEGTSHIITPEFDQAGPFALDMSLGTLPAVSKNGITGTWNPPTISTSEVGFFTFTFTPDDGQCATTATMVIEITNTSRVWDYQRNVYPTVKIGTQWWMAANLKTTIYNNGDPINTTVPETLDITGETEPKYQWSFSGNEYWAGIYGRLYTWYAINDSRGVCPDGWHVSTENDWKTLIDYLVANGYGYDGSGSDIAKSLAAKTLWSASIVPGTPGNDLASNNSSGFSALPGGFRTGSGIFNNAGSQGVWWSTGNGTYKALWLNSGEIAQQSTNKNFGASVRCVKD